MRCGLRCLVRAGTGEFATRFSRGTTTGNGDRVVYVVKLANERLITRPCLSISYRFRVVESQLPDTRDIPLYLYYRARVMRARVARERPLERLRGSDRHILQFLYNEGDELIAVNIDYHPETVRDRMPVLREAGVRRSTRREAWILRTNRTDSAIEAALTGD